MPESSHGQELPRPDLEPMSLFDIAYRRCGYSEMSLLRAARKRWPEIQFLPDLDDWQLLELIEPCLALHNGRYGWLAVQTPQGVR